ncbi:hypothetical protein MKEN_00495800 [Mycena kentingensis (nom. inval.)]|nr:hypothetical protein MKEN_00495800 [Mycena kentingensis (nom. inval.)]
MSSSYTVGAEDFEVTMTTLRIAACRCLIAVGLYGLLTILVVLALRHLSSNQRPSIPNRGPWLLAVTTIFLCATAQIGLDIAIFFQVHKFLMLLVEQGCGGDVVPLSEQALAVQMRTIRLYFAKDLFMATNNLLVDAIFIYRCYVVWAHKTYVVALPALMLLATSVYNYTAAFADDWYYLRLGRLVDPRYGLILSVLTNVVLVLLTAGRIWWARRQLRVVLQDPELERRYNTAMAMVIESGALYCANVIALVIAETYSPGNSPAAELLWGSLSQIINIAPLLIIVRVGFGKSGGEISNESATGAAQKTVLHFRMRNRSLSQIQS